MIMNMYSIRDKLSGFGTPIPFTNEDMAKRYFKTQLAENPIMKNSPEDFSLHHMGEFNTELGHYEMDVDLTKKIM